MRKLLVIVGMFASCRGLEHGMLQLPATAMGVDPSHPATKQQLTYLLGAQAIDVTHVEEYSGSSNGMWVVRDLDQILGPAVVELRSAESADASSRSEADRFTVLARAHPELERDPAVAFPLKILACLSAYGEGQGQLIVTRQAPGQVLAGLVSAMYDAGDDARKELLKVFEGVGRQLRSFHDRYGKQHGDFRPENVFVDVSDGLRITFVELGGMTSSLASEDALLFGEQLRLLSPDCAPPPFLTRCYRHFERGYVGTSPPPAAATPAPSPKMRATSPASRREEWRELEQDDAGAEWAFELQELEDLLTWEGVMGVAFFLFVVPLFLRGRRSGVKHWN